MRSSVIIGSLVALAVQALPAAGAATTSCIGCHSDPDRLDEEQVALVAQFDLGVHAEVGVSCHDCHGGNPDPALADDMDAAMDPKYRDNPFVGVPPARGIPDLCGRCHSDPDYMRRYQPDPRIDQEREYWTSVHGKRLRQGDTNVATCVSCHGVHGIRRISSTDAPVYPTRVAETCARCHADPQHMAGYTLPDGRQLPVDQYARWSRSVHAAAMFEKEDLSAPTCNDCHGNHGAAPPGLDSIAYVCGQCHGREAELFRGSPKASGFRGHNAYLADAGSDGCAACHDADSAPARVQGVRSFSECATCHGEHAVVRPTIAMLGPLPETPCAFCHEESGPLAEPIPEPSQRMRHYLEVRSTLLAATDLTGQDRFDWLVDQALHLDVHTHPSEEESGAGERALRPEFARLFAKFRIGKASFTYLDPRTGEQATARIRRCDDCHAAESTLTDPVGWTSGKRFLDGMHELTATTAQAQRILLAARRGGVETRAAAADIDHSVDAEISLQVLVHTFSAAPDGAFAEKQAAGMEFAHAALQDAGAATDELRYRRKGLAVSLGVVLLVLIFLGLKIRQL